MDIFAPGQKQSGCFIVKNISPEPKTIRIFQYPINWMDTRDLLAIPGVAENDIRASLLKGTLSYKLRSGEITVLCNTVDLLQFDPEQLAFLESAGITNGLQVGSDNITNELNERINNGGSGGGTGIGYLIKDDIDLIGPQNSINRTFYTPDIFINGLYNGNYLTIEIAHNGRRLAEIEDYFLSESGGTGTGFNTVTFTFSPLSSSVVSVNYCVEDGDPEYVAKQDISLIGVQNKSNRVFTTPDFFINGLYNGNDLAIELFHNGRELALGIDYTISESGGVGTGFNTVTFTFAPLSSSVIRANYYVKFGGPGYVIKQNADLIGIQNSVNRVFACPDDFIYGLFNGSELTIEIFHNGRKLALGIDFYISESNGPNTGFNTITFTFAPLPSSVIKANYCVNIL